MHTLCNSEAPGIVRSIAVDRHTSDDVEANHSLPTAFQVDASRCDNRGDQVQHSQSVPVDTPLIAAGSSSAVVVPAQSGPETNDVPIPLDALQNPRECFHRLF